MYGEYFDIPAPDELVFLSDLQRRRGLPVRLLLAARQGQGLLLLAGRPGRTRLPPPRHQARAGQCGALGESRTGRDFAPPAVADMPAPHLHRVPFRKASRHEPTVIDFAPASSASAGRDSSTWPRTPTAAMSILSPWPEWRPTGCSDSATNTALPQQQRYPNWHDLLDHGTLDVFSIATPTTLHAPIAIAALNAGLHVLSEKPMAENADTARLMVEAAERNDRVLDVSFNHRRRGDVQALKKIIDAGLLGKIYYAKAGWLRREGIPGLGSWFTRRATAGGGPLMDIGVHMLDMALYLLGEPQVRAVDRGDVRRVRAARQGQLDCRRTCARPASRSGAFDVEDLSTAFLRLDDGGRCCSSPAGRSGSHKTIATSRCTAPTAAPASSGARRAIHIAR